MSPDKLAYMANQIGRFYTSQGHDKAVTGVAEHLAKFWDPRMRDTILRHFEEGGLNLDPWVREAVGRLRAARLAADRAKV
jgi:formate dehydrogenase subunit delta